MNKLTEGFKTLRGNPVTIPGISRDELPQFCVDMGFHVGAEIGVYKAEYTEKFCAVGLSMTGIDPWLAYAGAGRTPQKQERQEFIYQHAQRVLEPYKNTATLMRKASMDAVNHFRDEALDFVYIDGDHSFPHVANDIFYWAKKVKRGGIVAGHDYFSTNPKAQNVICHVQPVVDAYVRMYKIPNLWIFGRDDLQNEKAVSWMFIKE